MNTTVDWPVERTARLAAGQTDGVLSDINFGEVFPFVAKPLSRDSLARYIGPMLGGQVAGLSRSDPLVLDLNPMAFVAGRPFMDLSAYINLPSIAYQLHLLEAVDRSKGRAIAELARAKRLNPVPIPVTARLTLLLAYVRMGLCSLRWLLRRRTPVDLRDAYTRTTERLRALVRRPLDRDDPSVLLRDLDREFTDESDPTKDGLRHLGLAMFLHTTLQRLCDGRIPPDLLDDLAKGIPHNPTTAVSLDLWALAQAACPLADVFEKTPPETLARALQTTEEGRHWWMRFDEFLARHGHRGEVELDLSTPRWREDPTFLLQTVTNYLRHPAGAPSPLAMLAEGQRRREAPRAPPALVHRRRRGRRDGRSPVSPPAASHGPARHAGVDRPRRRRRARDHRPTPCRAASGRGLGHPLHRPGLDPAVLHGRRPDRRDRRRVEPRRGRRAGDRSAGRGRRRAGGEAHRPGPAREVERARRHRGAALTC